MRRFIPAVALTLILAACATRTPPPEPPPRPAPPPPPLSAIHQNLSDEERAFNFRAGLNVAALSCVKLAGPEIVSDYNQFLSAKKAELATAYEAKAARHRAQGGKWERALDSHMTQLYNHFAAPTAQVEFCRRAAQEVKQAIAVDRQGFIAWAQPALARLDAPFAALPPAQPAAIMAMAAAPRAVAAKSRPGVSIIDLPAGWRIQLGAYSSRAAAEAAWTKVSSRSPSITGMTPHFEPVPGQSLVRLQAHGATSREQAIALCAEVAAVGLACIPVAPA